MTFFAWPGSPRGRHGAGQVTYTSFSIPATSMGWWMKRLSDYGTEIEGPYTRFDEEILTVTDHDGLKLELVAHAGANLRPGCETGPVPPAHPIRGVFRVTPSEPG